MNSIVKVRRFAAIIPLFGAVVAAGCGEKPQEDTPYAISEELTELRLTSEKDSDQVLAAYGKLPPREGEALYQIPIDRAMNLVAEEGVKPFDIEPPPPPPEPEDFAAAEAKAAELAQTPMPAFTVDPSKVEKGKALFTAKTCAACHSVDGSTIVGPSLKGFWGRATVLADATVVRGDAGYFASSIKNPTAQVVKGFPPAMPTLGLSDEEIEAVMHYVITLK